MKQRHTILLVVAAFWLCSDPSHAAPDRRNELGSPIIQTYTPQQYASHSQVWSGVQDRRGVLYFATSEAVIAFDGIGWRSIEIPGSVVRGIAIDDHGTIFVGSVNDVGYLARDSKGEVRCISLKDKLPEKERDLLPVWAVHATSHGVYFQTRSKLLRWHEQALEIIHQPFYKMSKAGDRLYLLGQEKGVYLLDQGNVVALPYFSHFYREKDLGDVFAIPWRDNKTLIITTLKGMFIHDTDRFLEASRANETTPVSYITPFETEADAYIRAHRIYSGTKINDAQFALGTHGGGVAIIDDAGKLVRIINGNRGLANDLVFGLALDNLGGLWALTNNGISHISINAPVSVFDKQNGIESKIISIRRYKGMLYWGSYSGIYTLPPYKMTIDNDIYKLDMVQGTGNHYTYAFVIQNGVLLSTLYHKIIQIKGQTHRSLKTLEAQVIALVQSKKFPNLIFAGTGKGISVLKISSPGVSVSNDEVSDNRIWSGNRNVSATIIKNKLLEKLEGEFNSMAVDQNGDIWATSVDKRIMHLHWPDQIFDDLAIREYAINEGLPQKTNFNLFLINGDLIVSTSNGLYKFIPVENPNANQNRGAFVLETTFGKPFIKSEHTPFDFVLDRDQALWVTTQNGFGKMVRDNAGSYEWDTRISRLFSGTTGRSYIDDDGYTIWFSTSNGMYRYDTTIQMDFEQPYHTLIRRVIGGDNEIINHGAFVDDATEKDGYYLDISIAQSPKAVPTLAYSDNSIGFEYGAAFYEQPENTQYRYRLAGFDRQWSQWSKEHKKEYTNLPGGNYCFSVQAKNIFDHIGETASFQFAIRPPWYRTIWAYIGYFLAGIALLAGSVKIYAWRLIESRKKLQRIVKEKTSEVVRQKDEIAEQKDQIEQANQALWGEMELAKKIQTVLLPTYPHLKGFEIAAYTKPADLVGGDYYDVINLPDQDWIVIGDVSGHGVPAGLVMMMVQTSIHSVLKNFQDLSPPQLLQAVNKVIYQNIQQMGENKYMTITVFSCARDGTLQFSGLHQDIMIYRANQKKVASVETNGMWIGMVGEIADMLDVDTVALESGDVMLLYTDGITEAVDPDGQMFGTQGLAQALSELGDQPVEEIKDGILKLVDPLENDDDITLMVIKRQ
ncbi:MAG: SpoIIE family protein phosphatase [Myxococcota bacterium]|nr:SpoIIE family protein phosphatase [Myxococcota bacterium]